MVEGGESKAVGRSGRQGTEHLGEDRGGGRGQRRKGRDILRGPRKEPQRDTKGERKPRKMTSPDKAPGAGEAGGSDGQNGS